jgi:hypothetical protein
MEYVIGDIFITGNGIPILYTRHDDRLMYGYMLDCDDTVEIAFSSINQIENELTNHGWQLVKD